MKLTNFIFLLKIGEMLWMFRLSHPWSEDTQDQETLLAPSADKETGNYDTECSNHHPSLLTLSSKRLSRSEIKW